MDCKSYILDAAAAEASSNVMAAFQISQNGYQAFPDNYELAFMFAGYSFHLGNKEQAYIFYLLAETLCDDPDDKIIIAENRHAISADTLDTELLRQTLRDVIIHRFSLKEYNKTYSFVSDILFSDNKFIFEKVSDKWLRYYLIILEITACEKNRACTVFTADHYVDWREFEVILREFKFAFRRIWFGFPENEWLYLKDLVEKYGVSPEFVVITGKYAVHEDYLSDVLRHVAELLSSNQKDAYREVILLYADWFSKYHKTNLSIIPVPEDSHRQLDIVKIDVSLGLTDLSAFSPDAHNNLVSYIMCANNEQYVDEILLYLKYQELPHSSDRATVYIVYHAPSMTAGYNLAMRLSRSACKIYIHQDTFIFDRSYTCKLIHAFETTCYDMLGLAGTTRLPASGKWWDSNANDMHLCLYQDFVIHVMKSVTDSDDTTFLDVDIVDGVLIATKKDVPWREDLFTGFHFYDISQGYEFKKRNFKIGYFHNKVHGGGVLHEVSVSRDIDTQSAYDDACRIFSDSYLA